MLVLKCCSCEQEINISLENLHNKVFIQCYNCDKPISKSAMDPLRRFGNAYMDLIDSLHFDGTHENSWSASIKSTDEFIPNKKSPYGFDDPSRDDSYWVVRRKPFEPKWDHSLDDTDINF